MNMALVILTFILKLLFLIFLIILPFLYDLNAKFRYYFKFFVFKALITFVSVVFIPFTLCRSLHFTNASIIRIFSYISRILNIRWSIKGVENLKLNESCVLVANHQNNLDVLGVSQIYAHLETSCVALANDDFIHSGLFGLCARLNRFTLVNESDKLLSHKNVLPSKVKQLKHDNVSILIFPEIINNRSDEGIRDFLKSAFILAIKEQLPIVPVVFSNYYFIDNHRKVFDPGYVTIEAMSPIRTDNLSIDDVSKLIEETRNKMRTTLKQLTAKLTPLSVKELRQQYTF